MEYEYAVGVKLDCLPSSNDRSVNSARDRLRHRRIGEQRVQALVVAVCLRPMAHMCGRERARASGAVVAHEQQRSEAVARLLAGRTSEAYNAVRLAFEASEYQ